MNDNDSRLPPDRLWQPTTAQWFAVIFGVSLGYSIIRYHVAGDVEWRHFPLFILNKATSLAAGYRALYQDYTDGSGRNKFKWNMTLHGPVLGLVVPF